MFFVFLELLHAGKEYMWLALINLLSIPSRSQKFGTKACYYCSIRASTAVELFFFSYLAPQKATLSILPTHFTKHPVQ